MVAEIFSGCGVLSACIEHLNPCFALGSRHTCFHYSELYGCQKLMKQGFGELHVNMVVYEVDVPNEVVLALEHLCCSFGTMPFNNRMSCLDVRCTFSIMLGQSKCFQW